MSFFRNTLFAVMLRHAWLVALVLCMVGGCWEASQASDNMKAVPKFELDIQPILTARGCNSGPCHGKSRGQNGFALSLFGFDSNMDYESLLRNGRGRRVSSSDPRGSLLLTKATGQEPHGGGVRLSPDDADYGVLLRWIENGAPRSSDQDPSLVSIQFSPSLPSLATESSSQVVVTATYSDGATRNVTSVCAFQSSDAGILSIRPNGEVKSGKHPGEATIMARYMGQIATWSTVVLKQERANSPSVYASLPRNNWIDDCVYEKLQVIDALPSDPVGDTNFLRRLYLDAIGRLPTPDEVVQFSQDPSPEKRNVWIAKVLNEPEYADFWANKWADLLRPNPYRVGIKATYSLDLWLRQCFRENMPHDRFVKELITAQGSTWRNGATTFFRDRREPEEITTVVSQLFLGVRLECAKCHQHPFEVYSQADFYGLAAFFAKIGQKGVGLSPPISGSEEIFFAKAKGDVRHPLTKQTLAPKTLRGDEQKVDDGADPRVALADWLVAPGNPYFAKAAVNRLWAEVMGVGIVDSVDDFRATNPPSNSRLLERLANYYESIGFDNKRMLQLIFESHVYQLSSIPNPSNASDHRNFSRHYRKRMRAEVLADALSDATGVPTAFPGVPPETRAVQLWTYRIESELLDAFSRPDANQDPPCERLEDTTMSQSLHLMNSNSIQSRISSDEGFCAQWAKSDDSPESLLNAIYLRIYSRLPTSQESQVLIEELSRQPNRRRWLEDVAWAMINSPEFVFID